jgi:hypothetical protein
MKTTRANTTPQANTGFIARMKTKRSSNLCHAANLSVNPLSPQAIDFAIHEKELMAYEIEAELRKASARTYANPMLIR